MSARPASDSADRDHRYPASPRYQLAALLGASRRHLAADRSGAQDMNSLAQPREMGEVLLAVAGRRRCYSRCGIIRSSGAAPRFFLRPSMSKKGMVELFHKRVLWGDIGDSLRRVAIGFGAAVGSGNSAGIDARLVSRSKPGRQSGACRSCGRSVPIAWIPVAIIFFGVGEHAAIFLIFLGAFFPSWWHASTACPMCRRFIVVPAATLDCRTGAASSAELSFLRRFRRSSSVCGLRWALPGWWWWRRKWSRSIPAWDIW